ncbi:MAG: hypothetical protein J7L08_04030 [Candidatus Aenigmarchaeota archaeon]|nr:hypothetical protein [Candidatus Aenigmarchaeota archaeon]
MGLIDGLIGAGTSLYGMYKGAQAGKKLTKETEDILNRNKSLADWYNTESNRDYFDTEAAKSGLARIREQYNAAQNRNAASGVQKGATTEAKVASDTALQDSYNRALANMTGYGTQYQTNMKRAYGGELGNLYKGVNMAYRPAVDAWGNVVKGGLGVAERGFSNADKDKVMKFLGY